MLNLLRRIKRKLLSVESPKKSPKKSPVKSPVKAPEKSPVKAAVNIDIYGNMFFPYKHIIHTGEGMTHGPSHLSQWIPVFSVSGEGFVVLVRNIDLFDWVRANYPYVTVIFAKGASDVETILNQLPFVKAFYYLSNTGNMIHSLRYNVYKHIFLGHGDSEKAASAHKFFRVYDEIWVAGEAHIDRFRNASFDTAHIKFVKIGRPMSKSTVKNVEDEPKTAKVLYLPTWEGVYEENNYSSLKLSATMLREISLALEVPINIKFHPVSGSRDGTLKSIDKKVSEVLSSVNADFNIADKLEPVGRLIRDSNIYICDISAVVSECLVTGYPIFVYIPSDREITISHSNMEYDDYAYTYSNVEELINQLNELLEGNDPKKEARLKARDYFISVEQTKNDEFARQLKRISEDHPLIHNSIEYGIKQ